MDDIAPDDRVTVTLHNGQRVKVDKGFLDLSPEEQNKTIDQIAGQVMPKEAPAGQIEDVAKSFGSGVQEGALSLPGSLGDVQSLARSKIKDWIGIDPSNIPSLGPVSTLLGAGAPLPTTEDLQNVYESAGLPTWTPQTKAGEYAKTGGKFVPNLIGGEASLPVKALTRVIGPAAATQAAGDITKKYAPEYEGLARGGTALVTGGAGALAEGGLQRGYEGFKSGISGKPMPIAPQIHDAPTPEALKAASNTQYKDFRKVPVEIKSDAVNNFATRLENALVDEGLNASDAPKTYDKLRTLLQGKGTWTTANYHSTRKAFGRSAFRPGLEHPEDAAASTIAIKQLDDFFENAVQGDLAKGTTAELAEAKKLLREANANYGAYKRSGAISGPQHEADLQAGATYSGLNRGNALRQKMKTTAVTSGGKRIRGFVDPEVKQLENIIKGSRAANVTRGAGNLMGGGGGLAAGILGGAPVLSAAQSGNWKVALGSLIPVAGTGMRKWSNAITENAVNELGKTLRRRSPLAESMPLLRNAKPEDELWLRALILAQLQQQNKGQP